MTILKKAASGISGLDEITGGGLPAGRPTLVCGGPGTGKTMIGISFLVHGAEVDNEPGVVVSFDETPSDLEVNSASLGLDLSGLRQRDQIVIDHVDIDRQATVETGDFDLEGLFIRIGHAVDRIGAKRVFLDSIDTLFAGLPNEQVLRSELKRLFEWLKKRGLSTVITAERGRETLTRHGIEEYVSDCVIALDLRVVDEMATRRLRVVKYRGSAHGGNEYPFLIDTTGVAVLPVTSVGLAHAVSNERISSGLPGLDEMLDRRGFYKGSSILLGGGPGSGKTSIGAQFLASAARRGEHCMLFAFEESEPQLVRNVGSIGIQLQPLIDAKRLHIRAMRPSFQGLESHLANILRDIQTARPTVVVVDPLSALQASGTIGQSQMMVLRLIDSLKSSGITTMFLSTQGDEDATDLNISSLMDTWIVLKNMRQRQELERRIYIAKSRGMAHSADVRQLTIGADGVAVSKRKEAP